MTFETQVIGFVYIILFFLIVLTILIAIVFFRLRRSKNNETEQSVILPQMAIMNEKLSHIEPITQAVSGLQTDMRGLGERISTVENGQNRVYQGVGYLATNALTAITELKSLTNGLNDATGAMRSELSRAKNDLTELHTHVKTGQEFERQVGESVRRLETIIAGTQTKGSAGENILEVVFSKLPVEWQVRDFKIGGKSVEFALRLPNNLILPIDSKWTASKLIEQFLNTEDIQEQQKIKKLIEEVVLTKAKEVKKYIDPNLTVNFGVAVIPDAVYDLCSGIQSEIFLLNVVIVSYSMFVPYLLLVFQTTLKSNQSIDLQKIDSYLKTAQESINAIHEELDGRFSRAITMMGNSRDELRTIVGKLGGSLTGLQMGTGVKTEVIQPPVIRDNYPQITQ